MSSTFSNLKFELIGNGEQSGTWGTTTNSNIGTAIEQALVGMATLDSGDFTANVATLTLANTNAAQDARALCLNIASGAVSAAGTVNVPAIEKPYIIINGSSFTVTVKVSGQTGVAVPAGKRTVVYNNGTDVGSQINWLSALDAATATLSGNLTLNGGTANGVAYLNGSKVLTTGSALTFDGSKLVTPSVGLTGSQALYWGSTSNVAIYGSSINNLLTVELAGSEQMRLTSTGLGIGTSSPAKKLSVAGADGTAAILLSRTNSGAASLGQLGFSTVNGLVAGIDATAITDSNNGALRFFTTGGSPQSDVTGLPERMRLDSSGNLGLGVTPSGNYTLQSKPNYADANGFKGFSLGSFAGGAAGNGFPWVGYNIRPNVTTADSYTYNGGDVATAIKFDSGIKFYIAPSGTAGNAITFTQAMTLDASGNLQLGTSSGSSTRRLTVYGSASSAASTSLALQNSTSGTAGSDGFTMELDGVNAYLYNYENGPVVFGTNNAERARIDSSGNLLVGTTSPSNNSSVGVKMYPTGGMGIVSANSTNSDSNYLLYSTGASAYRFYVGMGGTVFATSTTISAISDQRLKENVQDLDVGLDAIMSLKPRKFDWKAGKGKDIKGDRGWIAQEFEQVFPDMIDTWKDPEPEGEEPYKSVRADLIPILVKAIQELKAEFDAYKSTHP